jgi:26-hydroxylase
MVGPQGEVSTLLGTLSRLEGTPIDLGPGLAMAASNIICALTMSVRFEHNDLRFKRFMDLIEEGFRLFGSLETINFIPAMRFIPCFRATSKKLAEVSETN